MRPLKTLALLLVFLGSISRGETAPEPPPLRLQAFATGLEWEGSHFVRSDRKGNVYLFRAETGEVYPVSKSGEMGKPQRLQTANESLGYVHSAALSPSGNTWLIYSESRIRLFMDGKEKPIPSPEWRPWSVGFLRDTPVVCVVPRPTPAAHLRLKDLGAVPWLVTFDDDSWSTLVEHSELSAETAWKERSKMNDWIAEYAGFLVGDRKGKLWMASQYGYRVQRLSPSGRPLLEISVKGREAAQQPKVAAGTADMVKQAEARGGKAYPFTAAQVVAALVEGADGAIYLLVNPGDGDTLALDRYDSVRGILERASLSLKGSGNFTLASGKDGLYLAAWNAKDGRWRIPWQAIEEATWKEVEGVEVKGGGGSAESDSEP